MQQVEFKVGEVFLANGCSKCIPQAVGPKFQEAGVKAVPLLDKMKPKLTDAAGSLILCPCGSGNAKQLIFYEVTDNG